MNSSNTTTMLVPAGSVTPTRYARQLLDSVNLHLKTPSVADDRSAESLWAASGAMWLSGYADGSPQQCAAPLAACAQGAWLALSALAPEAIDPHFNAHRLLGERAAIMELSRQGRSSPGGACQLLETADGFIALNLARDSDRDLLPAWLEQWAVTSEQLEPMVHRETTADLLARARALGLAVSPMSAPKPCPKWFHEALSSEKQLPVSAQPLVVDLSSLWAGPLCAQLLADCGARVIKVESTERPDGARSGSTEFYNLLNAGKESVAFNLSSEEGRKQLLDLLQQADIVIEASRPRALVQMGIRAEELVAARPGKVWLSITGYGRDAPMCDWVAFGDDAGVAAGLSWLVGGNKKDPVFCGDAIADPLTGLHAALLALASWQSGGGKLFDVSLHDVVAFCIAAGAVQPLSDVESLNAARPVARTTDRQAAELGADTQRIIKEFSLGSGQGLGG